ncbi:MAG: hypothetical protein JNK82_17960 [Myxococcaceae bacterium]|nr:hypothetical protein [Myxococcaceae bacterium]
MFGVLITFVAAQSVNPYLEQARAAYKDFDYAGCLKASELAGRLEREPAAQANIEVLHAMCALELNRKAEATERLELALRIDPNAKLPPVVSPKLAALFDSIRARLAAEAPKPTPAPEPPAPPPEPPPAPEPAPAVESPAPAPAASQASVRLAPIVLFSVAAVAALGAGVGTGAWAQSLAQQNQRATFSSDIAAFGGQAKGAALAANVCFAAAGALAAAALLAWLLQL